MFARPSASRPVGSDCSTGKGPVQPEVGTASGALIRLVLLALVAWFALCAFLFLWPRQDSPRRVDAVVVLSGDRDFRLPKALELMRKGVAPTLVISDGRDPEWPQANRLCNRAARDFRVVCFKPEPYSTMGEAEAVARLGRARGWDSLVVVTSTFHIFRARMLFERCFPGHVDAVGAKYKRLYLPSALIGETGKLVYALTIRRDC
jgi:uncharacterized SAM-binding protein YcdF (DUF218 family)